MIDHTPGPWAVIDKTEIVSIGDLDIPSVRDTGVIADTHLTNDAPREIDIANAKHIVRCVNAHGELVAALERIEMGEGRFSRDPLTHASNTIEDMVSIAREALAKARGES